MTINVRIDHVGGPYDFEIRRTDVNPTEGKDGEVLGTLKQGDSLQTVFWKEVKLELVEVGETEELPVYVSPAYRRFIEAWNDLAMEVHSTAKEKGWWDNERNDGEMICLMHSELSEALEALRHNNPPDDKIPEFRGVETEFADVIIRMMDMALSRNHHVAEAVVAKMAFNKTRERMHGGKKF